MNKTLAVTAITLVAVVMGFSAVAPMIPQAEANPGPDLPEEACNALIARTNPPARTGHFISNHCPNLDNP